MGNELKEEPGLEEGRRLVNDLELLYHDNTGRLSALLLKTSLQHTFLLPMPRRNLHYHPFLELTPVAFNQHLSYEGERECPSWLSDHGLMNEEGRDLLPTGDESLPISP